MAETIYFDTCAINRLSDDESDPRVRAESAAVLRLLDLVSEGKARWTASIALQVELEQNPDVAERNNSLALLAAATAFVFPTQTTIRRATDIERSGLRGLDSLHLAIAEQAGVEWLVTTDDRFLRFVRRNLGTSAPQLINPVDLLQRRFPWLLPPKP